MELKVIARYRCDFKTKFGLPRQSGIAPSITGEIVFEDEYRDENALRGIEDYSHLWLLWGFENERKDEAFHPMVKPPRLGGNKKMGVFATRSPNRPNPIGLSSVKLESVTKVKEKGTILKVSGADLKDGTAIYDIKPYLKYTDSHEDAISGFAEEVYGEKLKVIFPENLLTKLPEGKRKAVIEALAEDVRPAYKEKAQEDYGFLYAGFDIRFRVNEDVLTVFEVAGSDAPKLK